MKLRFIEFNNEIYIVVGIGYNNSYPNPEGTTKLSFVAVPLLPGHRNIYTALLEAYSVTIPFEEATEITDKKRISSLMVLYGD